MSGSANGTETDFSVTVGLPIGTATGGFQAQDAALGAIHNTCSGALLPDPLAAVLSRSARKLSLF